MIDEQDSCDEICNKLNIYGCGYQDHAVRFLRDVLLLIDKRQKIDKNTDYKFETWEAEEKKFFPVIGSETFCYYFLDNLGLTEHGGSVPGWLTGKGRDILNALQRMKELDED